MKRRMICLTTLLLLLMTLSAAAQQSIRTTVVMRVSRMVQSAVVDAGEDLTIEVNIDGVAPESYQWFFNGVPMDGANQRVLTIVDAQPSDAGLYRLDAFDESGAMLLSMDIAARVVDKAVPQAGDPSLPPEAALGGMAACAAALALVLRRRARL